VVAQIPAPAIEELEKSPAFRVPTPPEVVSQLSQSRDPFGKMGKFVFSAMHECIRSLEDEKEALLRDITFE